MPGYWNQKTVMALLALGSFADAAEEPLSLRKRDTKLPDATHTLDHPPDDERHLISNVITNGGPDMPELEPGWSDPQSCWRAPQHICGPSTMLFDYCDNRNPGPFGCDRPDPFYSVGRLSNGCTGTLLMGNQHVLTAAHCVVDDNNQLKDTELTFSLGQYEVCPWFCPFGSMAVEKVYVPTLYSNQNHELQRRKAVDIAILKLNNPLVGATPFPPPEYVDYAQLWSADLHTLGYPADKSTGTQWTTSGEYQTMAAYEPGVHVIKTNIDGTGGQSGSPVYIIRGGERKLVGVLIGSPVDECEQGYMWVPKLTDWIQNKVVYAAIWDGVVPGVDTSNLDILLYPETNSVDPPTTCG